MNRHFFQWYYTRGLSGAGTLFGNAVRFVEHRFHLSGHALTLVAPWKRDVTFHTWRGLHPVLWLRSLFDNLFSRFMGMLVRLLVIVAGLAVVAGVAGVGALLLACYVLAPLFIVAGGIVLIVNPLFGGLAILGGGVGVLLALFGYADQSKDEPETDDITVLSRRPRFPRILARLGLDPATIDPRVASDPESWQNFLATAGIAEENYRLAVAAEYMRTRRERRHSRFWTWTALHTAHPIGKGWHYAYTPHLDRYCLDLSLNDPTDYGTYELVGRVEESRVVELVLERPTENSVILVGDPGIGKKTLIHSLARRIRRNELSGTALDDARVLVFDIGRAVGDAASEKQDVDNFLRGLFGEAAYAGNVILVIESIDLYLGGDAGHINLAPVLTEYLRLPSFRVIGTAPTNRYHAAVKTDEQALKYLETVYLRETNEAETLEVLLRFFEAAERKRVVFTIAGLRSVIASAGRYNWEAPYPERAIDLAQETLIYWQGTDELCVTPATVNAFVALKTGVPVGEIGADEKEKLLRLEAVLHERVIGQDEAVKQVAEAMRKARAGFGDEKRPLGSFIFLGPTGVGKTETVKAFAEAYFGSEDKMIRLDMSEYQTPEAVDRLIGSREMGVKGQLTVVAKEHPFSILLLDELEKAYPKALDVFLQILDEGFVTDGFGAKVSFRSMVIVATSNAGSAIIRDLVLQGAPLAEMRRQVLDAVVGSGLFRTEFLNRFDGVIFFEPLKAGELEQVVRLKLGHFAARLKKEKNIGIAFAPDVAARIVELGYEPEFGARSVNRYIEDHIEDVVVRKIISGEATSGGNLSVSAAELGEA